VGCYIWYSEEGTGRAAAPPSPLLAVPNVTAHPSTASVPITVLLYDGALLCGFNVAIKRLIFRVRVNSTTALFYCACSLYLVFLCCKIKFIGFDYDITNVNVYVQFALIYDDAVCTLGSTVFHSNCVSTCFH